jgi:hypothetical protein
MMRAVALLMCALTLAISAGAAQGAPRDLLAELPYVELSEASPLAVHYPDRTWAIRFTARSQTAGSGRTQGAGVCRETFINPEIGARGRGTAVHFATKYFCTAPVRYSNTTGVNRTYESFPSGPVVPLRPDAEVVAFSGTRWLGGRGGRLAVGAARRSDGR